MHHSAIQSICACVILLSTLATPEEDQPSSTSAGDAADAIFDDENPVPRQKPPPPPLNFSHHFNSQEILSFARQNQSFLNWSKLGDKTLMKKDIWLATIRNPAKIQKRAIFIDALMIPCEYQTASIVMYIMNELLLNSSLYQDILDTTTIYIVPIANRDGFEFNFAKTKEYQHARKRGIDLTLNEAFKNLKRETPTDCSAALCVGTSIATNFPFQWTALPPRAIRNFTFVQDKVTLNVTETFQFNNLVSIHYRGGKPCSEVECQNILNFLKDHKEIDTYVTLHGFINFWAFPYAYKENERPDNYNELGKLAAAITGAINVGSLETSRYGPFQNMFDLEENEIFNAKEHPGTPLDYAKSLGIRFTYWAAFGEYNNARYLEEDILRVCQDAFKGFLVLFRLKDRHGRLLFPSKSEALESSSLLLNAIFFMLMLRYWQLG